MPTVMEEEELLFTPVVRAAVPRVDIARVGPVTVTRIRAASHRAAPELRRIISAGRGLIAVTLHRSGVAYVTQGGRRARATPGDLLVVDAARPYEPSLSGVCDVVVIGLPRAMLGATADLIGRRVAEPQPCDRGTRAVIASFLFGLADVADRAGGLPALADNHVADALVSLIVAAFATPPPGAAGGDLTDRIRAYALANLGDPAISVASVARFHGISSRYLHHLFRQRGLTFAAWVRRERLTRIRRDLRNPAFAGQTVAVIAARWGIADPAHLSRALKKEFGQTATELRRTTVPRRPERDESG